MWTASAVCSNAGGSGMSAMLGSSRREAQMTFRLEGEEIVLVERQNGALRFWTARIYERLETLFKPPRLRP
jgi:hypothetical protein